MCCFLTNVMDPELTEAGAPSISSETCPNIPLSHSSCPSMSHSHTIYGCSRIRLNDNGAPTKANNVHRPRKDVHAQASQAALVIQRQGRYFPSRDHRGCTFGVCHPDQAQV